jgi:hypothetical protein
MVGLARCRRVTNQICSYDRVNRFRLQHHATSHGIHQHKFHGYIGEFLAQVPGDFIPQNHAITLRIALSDNYKMLPWSLLCGFKSETHDPFNSMTRKDGHFSSSFPWHTTMRSTALTGIFSFTVLADNNPIQLTGLDIAQGRLCATENLGWPNICVLLERLANCETKTPERDVIRNVLNLSQ